MCFFVRKETLALGSTEWSWNRSLTWRISMEFGISELNLTLSAVESILSIMDQSVRCLQKKAEIQCTVSMFGNRNRQSRWGEEVGAAACTICMDHSRTTITEGCAATFRANIRSTILSDQSRVPCTAEKTLTTFSGMSVNLAISFFFA